VPTEKPGSELATFDVSSSKFPVLHSQGGEGSIAQIIEDNFGDDGFSPADLDRLKVPSGGGQAWDIPDEDPQRFVDGIIIHRQPTRSFWFAGRGEGGQEDTPPDCWSGDAKVGNGVFGPGSTSNPTGACDTCPMNVFGSSDRGSGNGKACKEQMQIFMLQEGSILPVQVSLPPTSLKGFRKYMTRLASKGKSYYAVVTRLGLEKVKGGGQEYSVVEPSKVAELDPTEAQAARAFGDTIKSYLEQAAAARASAAADPETGEPGHGPLKPLDTPEAAEAAARAAQGASGA